jgi:hypothetical protein
MATIKTNPAAHDVMEYYNGSNMDNKPITITDSSGDAVSFSGKTMTFTVRKEGSSTAAWTIATGNIAVSGAGNNILTLTGENSFGKASYNYQLYNDTDDTPIAYGVFRVIYTT